MNLENILSKSFPKLPSQFPQQQQQQQQPMLPTMDQQMLQYLAFMMQQSNKPLIPATPPTSSISTASPSNPLLQCNMFFPFLPPQYQLGHSPLSTSAPPRSIPTSPRTPSSSTYSIENILSGLPQQKLPSQPPPHFSLPQPSQIHSQMPDATYLLNNLFTPSSTVTSNSFRPRPQPILRAHVTRESSKPLREWMISHLHDPYPTPNEIEELSNNTGFSRKQVRDWFTNNRRRYEQNLIKKNKPLPWKKREAPKPVRDPF